MDRIYLSPPDLSESDRSAVAAALLSNWVAPVGPALDAFEAAVSRRIGRKHALALNSGTAALPHALLALGIRKGDTVLCPTFTFAASANPITYLGAEPVFIDSETETWNVDPALVDEALERFPRTKAVIIVHLYGQCARMAELLEVCKRRGVAVIEDAAEAVGAACSTGIAGNMGDLSFFSFNGNKIITTSGGGMLLGDTESLIERSRFLASQAREPVRHYEHQAIGYNYRLSNVLAALGLSQLSDLDQKIERKRAHFQAYSEAIADLEGFEMMPIRSGNRCNYWLSCLTLPKHYTARDRDRIIDALEAQAIECRPLWKPLHKQPVFREATYIGGAVAERLFERGICMPSGAQMTDDQRKHVIDQFHKLVAEIN